MMKLKWWHKDPVATLTNRRNNLIELFNEGKEYPIVIRMFGFPKLIIYSKQEHYARIRELTDILNLPPTHLETETSTGTKVIKDGF